MRRTKGPLLAARPRLAALLVVLALAVPVIGSAHPQTNGYQDTFDTLGALPSDPGDPWQVTAGSRWEIADQPVVENLSGSGMARVLQQNSRATTPVEPMAFVRGRSFRSFTAQVTAAILDGTVLGDALPSSAPPPGSSLGIVFRAPILANGEADKDNLYLFTAVQAGVSAVFPTGKAFMLFKRVGRGYFALGTKIAHTFFNLRDPHEYKVVMAGGHIMAFVDGRLVIEHTDIPSGDNPTTADPFPGVPFDSGAVGLRTTGARAWFDDFIVIGTDAYEGRAQALDGYFSASANLNPARGTSRQVVVEPADTGYQYHDHDFEQAIVNPVEGPDGDDGGPSFGASLRTSGSDGVATSTARLAGVHVDFADPTQRVSITIDADAIETVATASCTATGSSLDLADASVSVHLKPASGDLTPETVIGPIPLFSSYPPNTIIYEQPGVFSIVAHARANSTSPRRIEASALRVAFPEQPVRTPKLVNPVNGQTLLAESTVSMSPHVEFALGKVVAGKYCS